MSAFDGGVGLTALETLSTELMEGDLYVRVEESKEFLRVILNVVFEIVREELLNNCSHKHESGNY